MARHRRRRKRKRQRFVYVVARPLKAAGPFSFVSEGKFSICHWGVLFSEFDGESLEQKFAESEVRRGCGTYIELFRDPSQTYHLMDFDAYRFSREWKYVSIAWVGKTSVQDSTLEKEAQKIVELYPDYNAYSNNCQNFVLYLLKVACPDCDLPRTIKKVVDDMHMLTYLRSTESRVDMLRQQECLSSYPRPRVWCVRPNPSGTLKQTIVVLSVVLFE